MEINFSISPYLLEYLCKKFVLYSKGEKIRLCSKWGKLFCCKNYYYCFLFIQKPYYNGHSSKIRKVKTKIHITVIRCKATITAEIKLKEEQLKIKWVIKGF